MIKLMKEQQLLVKLYTSLRFWGGLLIFFYVVFFLISFIVHSVHESSRVTFSLRWATLALAVMPAIIAYKILHVSSINHQIFFAVAVWFLQIVGIILLKLKAYTLSHRTIIVMGTIILLLLIIQFVSISTVLNVVHTQREMHNILP